VDVPQGGMSAQEVDDARTAVAVRRAALETRKAQVEERRAELAEFETQIARAKVVAPFDGVVSRRAVEVGQWLGRGDMVAEIVETDRLQVRVGVPEGFVRNLTVGAEVGVTFDALPGRMFTAKVDQVLPEADAASRTFPVRVLLANADGLIRPGFFGRVMVPTGETAVELTVPLDAVLFRGNMTMMVVSRDGVAALVPVERVIRTLGARVAVRAGVVEGEMVVTRGNESLRGGERLRAAGAAGGGGGGGR
jgi:RND family efflux transporter MFP subunit